MAIILAKWSKTNQFRNKVVRISIPALSGSLLCHVTALRPFFRLFRVLRMSHCFPSLSKASMSLQLIEWIASRDLVPPGPFTMVSLLKPLSSRAPGFQIVCGVILTLSLTLPLPCSRLLTYTYILDGCLSDFACIKSSKIFKKYQIYFIFMACILFKLGKFACLVMVKHLIFCLCYRQGENLIK